MTEDSEKKSGPGRKPHAPTEEMRRTVEAMAGLGIRQQDVADFVGVHVQTLVKHYEKEWNQGKVKALAKVARSLFENATVHNSFPAQSLYLRCQGGWKEPKQEIEATVVNETMQERMERARLRSAKGMTDSAGDDTADS